MIGEAIRRAIDEIRETFPGHQVDVVEDGQGGARVTVGDLDVGVQHHPSRAGIGFLIGFQYPAADVYPHFVACQLARADGRPLGDGFAASSWNGGSAVQVSRRSNRRDAALETAAIKLKKVLEWIRSR